MHVLGEDVLGQHEEERPLGDSHEKENVLAKEMEQEHDHEVREKGLGQDQDVGTHFVKKEE